MGLDYISKSDSTSYLGGEWYLCGVRVHQGVVDVDAVGGLVLRQGQCLVPEYRVVCTRWWVIARGYVTC